MILSTTSTIALRCPNCGKIEFNALSLFEFSGNSSVNKKCSCGEHLINIYSRDKKTFWVKSNCVMCDSFHVHRVRKKDLWTTNSTSGWGICCDETALEIGFIGEKRWVQEKVKSQPQSIAEIAEHMGFTKYFTNSEVMYEILEHLYYLAEEGNLFCKCGNYNLEIEIFPEHLELLCENCGCEEKIMAETEEDLNLMLSMPEIKLTEKGVDLTTQPSLGKGNFEK